MKKILCSLLLFSSLFILVGCTISSYKSYTFTVETGDAIEVKLDTSDGYDISSKNPFTISKDDETLSQGTFITLESYNNYIDSVDESKDVEVLDTGSKNGVTYTFYSYKDSEFNYIIKVDGSNTGVLLANGNSKSEAETVFELLTFSLK